MTADLGFPHGAGDGNRTRAISLGIRQILALNVEDLDLEQRRAPGPIQGRRHQVRLLGHRDRGPAARLLRLPDGTSRTRGPHTGRARLGYDRARVLFKRYTATSGGLELHQLRHSAATHLGDQKVPLQLIMAKTRHKSPRTAMRYVKPGDAPWLASGRWLTAFLG